MSRGWLAVLALIVALGLLTPTLAAHQGKSQGKAKGRAHDNGVVANQRGHQGPPADHNDGWERRDGWDYRIFGHDNRPPGWSRGKKTGWKDCGLPPGQAKKYGCRTYVYQNRRYYYYRDDLGRIIVRRPSIRIDVR